MSQSQIEKAVLGALLIDAMAFVAVKAFERLDEGAFSNPKHKIVFATMKRLNQQKAIDIIHLMDALQHEKEFEGVNLRVYIQELMAEVVTPGHTDSYIDVLRKNAFRSKIKNHILKLQPDADVKDVEQIITLINERDKLDKKRVMTTANIIDEYFTFLENKQTLIIPTGFQVLDTKFCPQPGDLVVIGGRTGEGKTAYLTNILNNMVQDKIPCLYCPTEMKPMQFLSSRFFPLLTFIPAYKFRHMKLTEKEIEELKGIIHPLKEYPLSLLDIAGPTIEEIKFAINETKCKVVFIDYLGRCSMTKEATRMREIEKFIVELKNFCIEKQILCFLAVQLARRVDFEDAPPKLADLSDSSSIEKEADCVIMLWRDKKQVKDTSKEIISATFRKNRFGHLIEWEMEFDKKIMRMVEVKKDVA